MKRIYDAKFAQQTSKNHHSHLEKFWWIDEQTGTKGAWLRDEAHDYVVAHPETVYVSGGGHSVYVYAYHYTNNPQVRWIQTDPDGLLADNLVTLAENHRE